MIGSAETISTHWARSIQPKFPEISVQNSMDRFGPTGKVSTKRVHLLSWSSFPGRTGWNFGWMDRAHYLYRYMCHKKTAKQSFFFIWEKLRTRQYHRVFAAYLAGEKQWRRLYAFSTLSLALAFVNAFSNQNWQTSYFKEIRETNLLLRLFQ